MAGCHTLIDRWLVAMVEPSEMRESHDQSVLGSTKRVQVRLHHEESRCHSCVIISINLESLLAWSTPHNITTFPSTEPPNAPTPPEIPWPSGQKDQPMVLCCMFHARIASPAGGVHRSIPSGAKERQKAKFGENDPKGTCVCSSNKVRKDISATPYPSQVARRYFLDSKDQTHKHYCNLQQRTFRQDSKRFVQVNQVEIRDSQKQPLRLP